MNHQALIERSHKQARDKGFWEKPLTFDMAMALIISEIAEALEAYRKGRVNPDWSDTQAVKDSFEVEIADAIIRIYDWCGKHNYELDPVIYVVPWEKNEGWNFMYLFSTLSDYWENEGNCESSMERCLSMILSYAKYHNIEIERFIEWKLDYNLNREYLHGKKF